MQNINDAESGLLNVFKSPGMTSFDVVSRVKRIIGTKKAGHCGTLDPIAEGVLLVLFGRATKIQSKLTGMDKIYRAKMVLGIKTDTLDVTGTVLEQKIIPVFDRTEIEKTFQSFLGNIVQTTPAYSAVKYKGRKLYEYAREGVEVIRPKRQINISRIDIISIESTRVEFRVACSSGTYIRALIDDVGSRLGCGAAMEHLIREQIGDFDVQDSRRIEKMSKEEIIGVGRENYEEFCSKHRYL